MHKSNGNTDNEDFRVSSCKLNKEEKYISCKNPHCTEFFCLQKNVLDVTDCITYLQSKKKLFYNKNYIPDKLNKTKQLSCEDCKKKCKNRFIYDYVLWGSLEINNNYKQNNIDKFKTIKNFYVKKLIKKYKDIPYKIKYEFTSPKPKTVVHWGQLKMFLITLIFLNKVIKKSDKVVHIIYPGSARGDNILILCDMFPNTNWYLIDPNPFHPKLSNHPQIKEIKNEYFTDELAQYYKKLFENTKEKLLLISDIRTNTDDQSIVDNQESNIQWHKIIQPTYSYFKFRCPYELYKEYNYYKGVIYIQPYAPTSSTETRILLTTKLEPFIYNIEEYQGKLLYFNRVIRPAYYKNKIANNYFDHCYDCTYFYKIIKYYMHKFKYFKWNEDKTIYDIMKLITNTISKLTIDKIAFSNIYVRNNIK